MHIKIGTTIADFFSVSIDELLGHRMNEREEALVQIKKEALRASVE